MLCPIRACHDRFLLMFANARMLLLITQSRCAYTMFYAWIPWRWCLMFVYVVSHWTRQMQPNYDRWLLALSTCACRTNVANLISTCNIWCVQAMTDVSCHCADSTIDACTPWPMLYYICRRCFPFAHMFTLDACSPWPTSPSWCTNSMFHTCVTWPMSFDVCKRRFTYAHMCYGVACRPWPLSFLHGQWVQATTNIALSMRTHHVWCMWAFEDVSGSYWTLFSLCTHPIRSVHDLCRPSFTAHVWCPHSTSYAWHT